MKFTNRNAKTIVPLLFCISMLIPTAQAFAGGECKAMEDPKKRMECIEDKIDNLLNGVKIEWRDHPGVCLYFKDWAPGQNASYSVLGCNNGSYVFNIHK